jgi:hypothetical protein
MSFEYNPVDLDALEGVRLVEGEISPKTNEPGSSSTTSKEQERKQQLVDLLKDDFEAFEACLDELMAAYRGYGRRNEFLSETLGAPDYINCSNCNHLHKEDGTAICLESGVEKDGKTLYNIVDRPDTLPSFCDRDMRAISFPEDRVDEVDDRLLEYAREGYEEYAAERREVYKQRREQAREDGKTNSWYLESDLSDMVPSEEEYTANELTKLLRHLYDPRDREKFRRAAIRAAWILQLDDVLQEEYYPQRAEAYLRALSSPYQNEAGPGAGGDAFEKEVKEYLSERGFPLYNTLFELDGVSANYKEMDVHTDFPSGDRAIFEVFTAWSHGSKDVQLRQYAKLLQRAEGVEPIQILFPEGKSWNILSEELLFQLLTSTETNPGSLSVPGSDMFDEEPEDYAELVGEADSLEYDEFEPNYTPTTESRDVEGKLINRLRSLGYNPTLPVYSTGFSYGFCGPTVELGGDDSRQISLTLYANRRRIRDDEGHLKPWAYNRGENGRGYDWRMEDVFGWPRALSSIQQMPAIIVRVTEAEQFTLTPLLLDALLDEPVE